MEGVMMRNADVYALALRMPDGSIQARRLPWFSLTRFPLFKLPFVRGFPLLVETLVNGIKALNRSAEALAEGEEEPLQNWQLALTMLCAVGMAVLLFVVAPHGLSLLMQWLGLGGAVEGLSFHLWDGFFKCCIVMLYIRAISWVPDIRRVFQYHGAEHKTIHAFESGQTVDADFAARMSRLHPRCGTTFLFYTVFLSIIVMAFVTWLLSFAGITTVGMQAVVGGAGRFLYNLIIMGVGLCSIPVVAGLSYELLRFVAKMPDNAFFLIFKAPGFALQALTTKKPDDDMAEAAIAAFSKVLEMDADPSVPTVDFYEMTMKDARAYLEKTYADAGIEDKSEADWMLCAVLKVKRNELGHINKLDKESAQLLIKYAEERASGKPLDYVTGESDFYGIKLHVTEAVHLPRPETETVALEAVRLIKERGYATALDLMTGSGCIAALMAEKTNAEVTASDISEEALAVARGNLPERVKTVLSDMFENVGGSFDIIVSNPPYIRSGELDGLQREVTCQPRIALDGGADGLDFYRKIAEQAPDHLNAGGALVLETGYDQAADVVVLLKGAFYDIKVIKDIGGRDRVVTAVKK